MNHLDSSIPIFSQSVKAVASRPFRYFGLLLGIPAAILVSPLWGLLFSFSGLITARRQLDKDGLSALGSVLAPRKARQQYNEGVFRGLWRVHGLTLSVILLQAPVILIFYFPVELVWMLVKPICPNCTILPYTFGINEIFLNVGGVSTGLFPENVGAVLVYLVVGLVILFTTIIFVGQFISLFRLVSIMSQPYSLGTMYRMVSASWRVTIKNSAKLVILALLLVFLAIIFIALSITSIFLARFLDVGVAGEQFIMIWTVVIFSIAFISILLESVVRWSYQTDQPTVEVGDSFNLSSWLSQILSGIYDWILHYGLHALATALCIVAGLFATLLVLFKDKNLFSPVGLGWFAVTSIMLVVLVVKKGDKS